MISNLVSRVGHWSLEDILCPWNYEEEAKVNAFFAQVCHPFIQRTKIT
jgi:hypothetical protein